MAGIIFRQLKGGSNNRLDWAVEIFSMWKLLALCALAVAIEGFSPSEVEEHKLKTTGTLIYGLDKKLENLRKEVKQAVKFRPKDAYKAVAQRVEDAEEHCEFAEYFQCGGNYLQCLAPLKVCDGVKDCVNGHDEDHEVCWRDFLAPGTKFDLRLTWHSCENYPDQHYEVRLRELHRNRHFGGTADVTVDVFHPKHKLVYKGVYNYGKKELILFTNNKIMKNYQVVCDFSDGSRGRADCYVETKSSLFFCGYGYLIQKS